MRVIRVGGMYYEYVLVYGDGQKVQEEEPGRYEKDTALKRDPR